MNKPTGYKLKHTREILELYLSIMEMMPNDSSHVRMMLQFNPLLTEKYERKEISIMTHNLRERIRAAYYVHAPETPPHQVEAKIGMMHIDAYLNLIREAIKLPKELCSDLSINI